MSKMACEKKDFRDSEDPKFQCKKCGARVKKEDKICKPKKLSH